MFKHELPGILRDNDAAYLDYINTGLHIVDTECEVTVIHKLGGIGFNIKPSNQLLKQQLIRSILNMHNRIGMTINLSKTITTSPFINFSIDFGLK